MLVRYPGVLRSALTVFVLLSVQILVLPPTTFAQDKGLSFEQAQTRTTYARKLMQKAQSELKEAESREDAALRELAELQKRQVEVRKHADQATEARQSAEKQYQQAHDKWLRESARLKRLHQRNDPNNPAR
jgi:hypothetical protein